MPRKIILKSIRMIILVMLGLIFGTFLGGIYYLNQYGVNEQWRYKIAKELENLDVIVDFQKLRYNPLEGLVAEKVRVFSDDTRSEVVAHLEHLIIDVDKTKIIRGKLRINNIMLSKASLTLRVDPDDPNSERILIQDLEGNLALPDKHTLEARKIKGEIAGIRVILNAHLWSKRNFNADNSSNNTSDDAKPADLKRSITNIINELKLWSWPRQNPPELIIDVEGSTDSPQNSYLIFSLKAKQLSRNNVSFSNVHFTGDYNNKTLTIDSFSLNDRSGKVSGKIDYYPLSHRGKFELTSDLHLQELIRQFTGSTPLHQITFSTPPKIECVGNVQFDSELKPEIQLTGKIKMSDFSFRGSRFNSFTSDISLKSRDLFFTNSQLTHDNGILKGRLLIKKKKLKYELQSTMPANVFEPFVADENIKQHLNYFNFPSNSKILINCVGSADLSNPENWEAKGDALLNAFIYRGVPLHKAEAHFTFNKKGSEYKDVKLDLDYSDYKLRKKYGGPTSCRVKSDRVRIDVENKMVQIKNIQTQCWPVPVIRLFNSEVADHCEEYRFSRPPYLKASGSFDMNEDQRRTDFKIDVKTSGSTYYKFLDEDLNLRRLRGKVRIRKNRIDATNLSFTSFQGPFKGGIIVKPKQESYQGYFQWSRLHFKDLGDLYDFEKAERGLITGRLDFSGAKDKIRNFNGKGVLALEKGNLFSIPMLGPLSPLISAVLGDKNPTNEHAENASCTFSIRKGIIYSDNFLANTRSLKFTGEGKLDLKTKQINMLIRMNARGLFSVLTLPLRPFMGLFQFKGKGDVSKPTWKTSIFTTPKKGKKDPIFRRPPKAHVIRE